MKYPSPADIAEMKARGYDSTTIAEAERQAKRWPLAQQVCQAIETAFLGVTLGNGVGLTEAQGLDDYADKATLAAYRANDEKDDWHRISAEALNDCNSSLSFFDAEGMRFHLPAYLLADLRGDYGFGMSFCLTHLSDHSHTYFELLSPAQRAAVRTFLLHILDDPEEKLHRSDIVFALDGYWTDAAST
ncbi:MAG: DUF6714 family protein [Verrucomicrobiota bacterium]